MSSASLSLTHSDGQVIAVPAIHFCHVFAAETYRICADPDTRPDAIAVELGPRTASSVLKMLRELGVASENQQPFPVLLGLLTESRMIRSSFRKKAFQLQRETGKDLAELSQDILYQELLFAKFGLIALSPVDSIIEAVRSSLELSVPLYGVDLDETPTGLYGQTTLEDPFTATGNVAGWIARNANYAALNGDEEVDYKREFVMAARLKALCQRHRRILFTCGVGHWLSIRNLILAPSVRPASMVNEAAELPGVECRKVILHPTIALKATDLFPAIVQEYEAIRRPLQNVRHHPNTVPVPDPRRIFENLLTTAYAGYFGYDSQKGKQDKRSRDLESLAPFEKYLENLCLLSLQSLPDTFMTLRAAQEMMSKDFSRALAETFLEFPWASPEDYSDYSIVAPSPDGIGSHWECLIIGHDEPGDHERVYLHFGNNGRSRNTRLEIPDKWKSGKKRKKMKADPNGGILHTWRPWEFLITSMSLRAIGQSRTNPQQQTAEIFDGNLMEGIDVKATLRANSSGRDQIHVRNRIGQRRRRTAQTIHGFPVVWLLNLNDEDLRGCEWSALYEDTDWMENYIHDHNALDAIRKSKGGKMVALIGYGQRHIQTNASEANKRINSDRYRGILIYGPICWTRKQFALWAEWTAYTRNPFCNQSWIVENSKSDLTLSFEREHNIKIGQIPWTTALILMAIPFAKSIVPVVKPDHFKIDPMVFQKARKYGVEVCPVSLSSFTPEEREHLSVSHLAPAVINDPRSIFHESVEEAIGEKVTNNEDLVPKACLEFGLHT